MAKVFITGGAGFVGSRVAKRFVDQGDEVFVFDTFKQYLIPDPAAQPPNLLIRLKDFIDRIELIQGDTLNKDHLRRVLAKIRPDVIVHMAALPLAFMAIEHTEDAFHSILESTINFLEIVRDFEHPCRLVYTSSSMTYGDFVTDPVTEDSPQNPKEIYGSFKLAGEIVCRGYMKCYGLDVSIVRPSAVYGPYDANQRVLQKFITRALNNEPLKLDGDGSMRLDFTYVEDAAQAIWLVATHPKARGETFNVTRGEARSLKDAIQIIQNEIPGVRVEYGPVPAYMPRRGTLDVGKAKRLLGYEPRFPLERGVPLYIEHLRNNPI
ncbi:MAG: NAD-dependent epimerase/dehydratase family protein [Desulfovibrionaceae bacterium]|nr:NAD-dependent epimerase/dehydratase family protein [Desulfovibrionaceae bacterium]